MPGTAELRLEVVRLGRQVRTLSLTPLELPSLYAIIDLSFAFAGLALGVVSLALVLLRPSRMTWGFALVSLPLLLPDVTRCGGRSTPQRRSVLTYEIFVALLYAFLGRGVADFCEPFSNRRYSARTEPRRRPACRSGRGSGRGNIHLCLSAASGCRRILRLLLDLFRARLPRTGDYELGGAARRNLDDLRGQQTEAFAAGWHRP